MSYQQAGLSNAARDVVMGTQVLLQEMGFASLVEFKLPNGRRADIAALNRDGMIWLVEVKSCRTDFVGDAKWPEYAGFADRFFFAVDRDFPNELIPEHCGLILADRFGGHMARKPGETRLHASRRKALTLRFARTAAQRLPVQA